MPTPLFYSKSLGSWDKITIATYIILTIIVAYYYIEDHDSVDAGIMIFGYAVGTHLFLYSFNYISLRNFKVYLIWLFISIFHFVAYLHLRSDITLQNVNGHGATGLRNTIILLILIQMMRYISIVTQGQEFVAPSRGIKDSFNERVVSPVDVLLCVAYLIVAGFLTFYE
jgi:bacteriorhodopsin